MGYDISTKSVDIAFEAEKASAKPPGTDDFVEAVKIEAYSELSP